ncbi:nucleotide exchange factor GrpE [Microcella daejeonensis]|uniref:nucleotide exchange factor GrpE n=1 Tax=Microcella daejeonensis TaxID=2994971 RepID=UPI00226FB1C1|nr:nucleotide exchange factor GrpE [Microcella daejeonensis]WAB84431.1 nucleotide exchange factor GrpE [Microcella daejeonensis]
MARKRKDDDDAKPVIKSRKYVDPETGATRDLPLDGSEAGGEVPAGTEPLAEDGAVTDAETVEELFAVEDADVEVSSSAEPPAGAADAASDLDADIDHILSEAGQREIEEYRDRAARAEAELANFRTRVERDRAANRDAVIAEVVRTLLPAIDDLDRASAHGDLDDGPLALVAQKLRTGFEKYGLRRVGVVGEPFDPSFHEALVQLPKPDVTVNTVGDVIEVGYALGDRLVRAAKVAVFTPEG